MQIVVARRVGEGRRQTASATFGRALLPVAFLSTVLAVALWAGAGPIGGRLIPSAEVAHAVEDFFRFGAWGIVFLSLTLAYSSLLVGLGRTRVLIGVTAVVVLVNLVSSWALIFGELGLPPLGIEGAGIGFLAAEAAAFAVISAYTARHRLLGLRHVLGRSPVAMSIRRLVRLGGPIALQALVEALRWVVFFWIVARLGEEALAWSSVVFACYGLLLIPSHAFAETGYTMTSAALGRGEADGTRRVIRAVLPRAYAVVLPLLVFAFLLPETTLALFSANPSTLTGAKGSLQVVALAMLVVVAADIALAAVFGTGDTDSGFLIELLISGTLVLLAALAALALGLELAWVWLALPLASGLGLAASGLWLRSSRWKRASHRTEPSSPTEAAG